MRVQLLVAWRQLLSVRRRKAVSGITMAVGIGIAVSSFAVIVILSVFNGITTLIGGLYTSLDTDLAIERVEGGIFDFNDSLRSVVMRVLPEGVAVGCQLSEKALFSYGNRQHVGDLLGVDSIYAQMGNLADHCVDGEMEFYRDTQPLALLTTGMAYYLGASLGLFEPITVYMPNRLARHWLDVQRAFMRKTIYLDAIISVNGDFDESHVVVPIPVMRELLRYKGNEVNRVHLTVPVDVSTESLRVALTRVLGTEYRVLNRYEQNSSLYRTMRSERLAIVLILLLILVVASFTLVGCISMLSVERREQMQVLGWLGMPMSRIRGVFLLEGVLLTLGGVVSGLTMGLLVCWLQARYELVQFRGSGTFVVNAYPVEVHGSDVCAVLLLSVLIGFLASWLGTWGFTQRMQWSDLRGGAEVK